MGYLQREQTHQESCHQRSHVSGLLLWKFNRAILLQKQSKVGSHFKYLVAHFFVLIVSATSPTYPLGIATMIICNIAEVLIILVLGILLARENQRRDRLQEGVDRDLDHTAFSDLTDRQNVQSTFFVLFKMCLSRG